MHRNGKALAVVLVVILLLGGCWIVGSVHMAREASSPEGRARKARHDAAAAEFASQLPELLSDGSIHSVDVRSNLVRIDPELWQPLPIEAKQGLVLQFSWYFEYKGAGDRVEVRSSRSDQQLATYSYLSGCKILY